MTAKYFAILTSQGAAKLANATALGTKLNLTQMAVGDGNGTLPTPDPAQTRLLNQKRIAPLNMLTVDPANTSQIIAEQIIPENEGGFWIREIGLYDDAGVLIAVANCPETYKPQLQEGSGRTQTIRMILIVSSTEAVTLKIDPSVVLATRKYVDDKVIEVKAYADALMAAHLAAADPHSQYATKASPALTGTPNAPTPVKTDNTTRLATTAHVKQVVADYAPLANPALTGKPTAPTAAQTSNDTQLATTAFVKDALAALVDSSPEALDTLNELAAALGDDPNFAATMTAELARKMDKDRNGADIPDVAAFLNNLGLEDLAKTSANNTFTGEVKFTLSVSLPANTAYKGIGLQAWFDYKQDKDDTLTALSGKDVAGLLSYLGLTSAAKTDAQNTFTQKQTFSGSVALPSDTTLNGTGLEYLFDSKLDASKALGTGQTWVNVTASRTSGVTYTNSTTRPICVSIPETGDGDRGLYVGGVLTAFARGADSDSTLFAIVPPGAQYIFSGAFSSWAELR
ncbi:phage tail protein [Citrobacter sp. Cf084]|uniref:phage tail protein n=1 Tax=Citrobacter sp. Cf084 TaxID=2985053 RepID=UPI002574FC2B|nr:phage tail protein [Citrobacter sp. Cf084]MDM3218698.1 phage tail protein [Citrobacter sp. Cf084]